MTTTEKIARLAELSISLQSKAMIALVLLGEKPAFELNIYSHNTPASIAEDILKFIGLSVLPITRKETINTSKDLVATFAVAVDEITARLLTMIENDEDYRITPISTNTGLYHKLYGVLMGHPLSAIEGFLSRKTLQSYNVRHKEVEKSNHLIDYFGFSQDFFKKEIKIVSTWRAALEQYAPQILKEYEEQYFS